MDEKEAKSQAGDKYIVRFPDGMRDRIADASKESNRSMNAEIVERLSRSFVTDDTVKLLRGNMALLRTLAHYVVLRQRHPEATAVLEPAMLKMAQVVDSTDDDAKLREAATPALGEYLRALVAQLEEATRLLGPGWAKDQAAILDKRPEPTEQPVRKHAPARIPNARKPKA